MWLLASFHHILKIFCYIRIKLIYDIKSINVTSYNWLLHPKNIIV